MGGLLMVCGWLGYGLVSPVPTLMFGQMIAWFVINSLMCAVVGRFFFAFSSGASWFHRSGGHLELLPQDRNSGSERSRLDLYNQFKGRSFGGLLLRCRHLGLFILVWTMPMLLEMLGVLLLVGSLKDRWSSWLMEICLLLCRGLLDFEALVLLSSRRLKVMLMKAWYVVVGFGNWIKLAMTWLIRLLILGGAGLGWKL